MKIQIAKAIKQGLEVIIKNPVIATMVVLNGILVCIYIYFFVYAPKLAMVPVEGLLLPELPANFWVSTILFWLVSLFIALVICKMVYDTVKGKVSLSEAMNVSARKFIFIFIAGILYILIVGVGFVALIIPGIFLSVKFVFYSYAILLDNERIINSLKKSWQITKGNWWKVFGFYLVFLIPIIILSVTASEIAVNSVPIALVIDFIAILLGSWLIAAFTIIYIQLTTKEQQDKEEVNRVTIN